MDNFTPEIQDSLKTMFMSDGWKLFIGDATANRMNTNTLTGINGEQALGYKQGQLAVLDSIISYEDTINAIMQQSETEENSDTPAEADEITL